MTSWPGRLLLVLLTAYRRFLSPGLGNHCRFYPSCSAYAERALREHGAIRGSALAIWRLLRCHPLARGGYDPVPAGSGDARSALGISQGSR
jgi:putative membrane protein insertion efficiency factor